MQWTLGFIGIILLIVGLVGQAFEMRKIRLSTYSMMKWPLQIFS